MKQLAVWAKAKLRSVADAGKSVAAVTLRYADNTSCYNQIEIELSPAVMLLC